ncbi:hypothetical protein SUGI_0552860 [Cryptomeria japonica]|nr:hypothetical protein SUGI_0552860 [Cryptomeria japonica]
MSCNCHVLKLLIPASLGTISEGSGLAGAVLQCFAGTDCLQSEDVANENQVAQDEENRTLLFAEFFSYLCVQERFLQHLYIILGCWECLASFHCILPFGDGLGNVGAQLILSKV